MWLHRGRLGCTGDQNSFLCCSEQSCDSQRRSLRDSEQLLCCSEQLLMLSIHVEAWPRPCEARPQATGHGKNFYTQCLEDVQHWNALPVPLPRQVHFEFFFGVFFVCVFRVLFGCPKGPKRVPKRVQNRWKRGLEKVSEKGSQKSSKNADFRDPPMWRKYNK